MGNLPLLSIGDYYYHSHDKMVKGKMETRQKYGTGIGGVRGCVPRLTMHSLVTLFSLSVSVKDRPLQ